MHVNTYKTYFPLFLCLYQVLFTSQFLKMHTRTRKHAQVIYLQLSCVMMGTKIADFTKVLLY